MLGYVRWDGADHLFVATLLIFWMWTILTCYLQQMLFKSVTKSIFGHDFASKTRWNCFYVLLLLLLPELNIILIYFYFLMHSLVVCSSSGHLYLYIVQIMDLMLCINSLIDETSSTSTILKWLSFHADGGRMKVENVCECVSEWAHSCGLMTTITEKIQHHICARMKWHAEDDSTKME